MPTIEQYALLYESTFYVEDQNLDEVFGRKPIQAKPKRPESAPGGYIFMEKDGRTRKVKIENKSRAIEGGYKVITPAQRMEIQKQAQEKSREQVAHRADTAHAAPEELARERAADARKTEHLTLLRSQGHIKGKSRGKNKSKGKGKIFITDRMVQFANI